MSGRIRVASIGVVAALLFAAAPVRAQQMVYRPLNPAFGGNPINYSWMLSSAQAQKRQPDPLSSLNRNPLQDFQQGLQRQVLAALSRQLIYSRFGDNIDLTKEGRYDLGDFTIEITPGLDGVDIRVTNVLTGDESLITIPNY